MTQPDTARAHVTRSIAADPTSTALLLAGPTAMDLWPRLRRVGEVDGRVLVEAGLSADETVRTGTVQARPPRRTPTAYVTRFRSSGPGLPDADGTLTLAYDPHTGGRPTTRAALTLDVAGLERTGLSETTLRTLALGFLDNLAAAAESSSHAA